MSEPQSGMSLPSDARIERPWIWMFVALFGLLLVALLFWPGAPLEWKMYAVVHGVCAQQHNLMLGGAQLPICARNSGIYSSFLLSMVYFSTSGRARAAGLPPWPISLLLLAFIGIMAVDGFNSLLRDIGQSYLYEPHNLLRTITGMGMGVSIAVLLHLMLNKTLRKDVDDLQPVLQRWGELGAILGINMLVLVAIYGNLSFMFWPLAMIAFFGITGVLYLVFLLLMSMLLGYEGKITQMRQLARPATLALLPTLLILGVMSWLRFWLEGFGLVV